MGRTWRGITALSPYDHPDRGGDRATTWAFFLIYIETARRRQRGARSSLCLGSPRSRSPLALPIAAYALPGLRPLGFFRAVLRAVRRQGAREALLGDRVLAPRADEPDRPGGDLPGVAGYTPHGPRRGMALDAHPLGLPPCPSRRPPPALRPRLRGARAGPRPGRIGALTPLSALHPGTGPALLLRLLRRHPLPPRRPDLVLKCPG